MDNMAKMIKTKMIEKGRDDFVTYLAEILGVSKQWASSKLNGSASFTDSDLTLLDKELNFEPEELKKAIT